MVDAEVMLNSGAAAVLTESAVNTLRAGLRGKVILPDDGEYDAVRMVWNGMIDKRPACIVRCTGAADVIAAVNFAREHGLLISVRGGGHNVSGKAVCDGGIMIDLSLMKGVYVDPRTRTVRAQSGALLGDLDRETQVFGLAVPAGIVSTTGIAGLTLGGGFGWLMRKHGLTIDNLLSVDVVTADGQLVRASETENADLFWATRGGGGNFGIVTSFEYRAHPVGPTVMAGLILYPMEQAGEFLRFYREYTANAPDEVMALMVLRRAPALPFVPKELHGVPMIGTAVCHCGTIEEGQQALRPVKEFGSPVLDLIGPKPFTTHQTMFDAGVPHGLRYYIKSEFLSGLRDDAINAIGKYGPHVTSPLSLVGLFHLGGAVNRVNPDAMAYNHRGAAFMMVIQSAWKEPVESDRHIVWTREFWTAMKPFSTGGVNVNFLSADEGEDRVREAYSEVKYERLVSLKNKYDPTNLFRVNQNIQPQE